MDLSELMTDQTMEKEGVWFTHGDARFRIASENSPAYQRAIQRHTQTAGPMLVRSKPEEMTKVMIQSMADGILLEWEGLTAGGEVVACHVGKGATKEQKELTRANKVKILSVPAMRNWISVCMQDLTRFQAEADADVEKTLGEP